MYIKLLYGNIATMIPGSYIFCVSIVEAENFQYCLALDNHNIGAYVANL